MHKILNAIGYAAAIGLSTAATADATVRTGWRMDPHPMPHQFVSWLDSPVRLHYRNPRETVGRYGIDAGMSVLDVGCGSGLFTAEMAKMVGPEGKVHAVDLQYSCLAAASTRLAEWGLDDRVLFHHCGLYDLPLADDSVDLAIMIATIGELSDPYLALAEIKRVLKPGARIAISEEMLDPAYRHERIVKQYMEEAGFHYGGKSGNAFCYSLIYFNHE